MAGILAGALTNFSSALCGRTIIFLLQRCRHGNLIDNMTGSAARFGGSPGPVFALDKGERVEQMKLFKTYKEQVELLGQRGMQIDNSEHAEKLLAQLNYYRLSGYWYRPR